MTTSRQLTIDRWLHRSVIYPSVVKLRGEGSVFRHLRELEEIQWLSTRNLVERQCVRLAEVINYASHHSPYYRRSWGELKSITPSDARAAVADLPMLTKDVLQSSFQEMRTRPPIGRVTRKITGGSTGQPVTVLKNRAATAAEMAASWLGYGWFGVDIGDRSVRFWGRPTTLKRTLRFIASDLAMHRIRFSAFAFDDEDLDRYWHRCALFRPDYLYGYVAMIEAFAAFVLRRGYDGTRLGLKSVITTAEVLSRPQRTVISQAFAAPIQNEYGCGEVGPIAYECDHGLLHLMTENQFTEVLLPDGRPAGSGETGEVVVTDLNNRAMPIVRYRLGDLAVVGDPCACGRGFPTLQRVWGRAYDFVQDRDGKRYHGEFFMYLFEDLRAAGVEVGQFCVNQPGIDSLEVAVVATGAAQRQQWEAQILGCFHRRLPAMRASVRWVESIPKRGSGKSVVVENTWLSSVDGQRGNSGSASSRN